MADVIYTAHVAGRVEQSVKNQLEAVAKAHDRTIGTEVRRAIKVYLDTIEQAEAGTAA